MKVQDNCTKGESRQARRRIHKAKCLDIALQFLGLTLNKDELKSKSVSDNEIIDYGLMIYKLKNKFKFYESSSSDNSALHMIKIQHNKKTYIGSSSINKDIAHNFAISWLLSEAIEHFTNKNYIADTKEYKSGSENDLLLKRISKFTDFFNAFMRSVEINFISKCGPESNTEYTFTTKYLKKLFIGTGRNKDLARKDGVMEAICYKISKMNSKMDNEITEKEAEIDKMSENNGVSKIPDLKINENCSSVYSVTKENGIATVNSESKIKSEKDLAPKISDIIKVNNQQTFDRQHFADIFLKPHTRKMWTYTFSDNTVQIKILDKEYKANGSNRQNSYVKAMITAFIDFKIHSLSNNIQLRNIYERIVIDIYDYMNNIKIVEHKSITDNNSLLLYFVNIKIENLEFIGFGSSKKIAYERAVIESLMFFANSPNNNAIFSLNTNKKSPTNEKDENNKNTSENDGSQFSNTKSMKLLEKKNVAETCNLGNSEFKVNATNTINSVPIISNIKSKENRCTINSETEMETDKESEVDDAEGAINFDLKTRTNGNTTMTSETNLKTKTKTEQTGITTNNSKQKIPKISNKIPANNSQTTFNREHFANIFLKRQSKKMWTYTVSNNTTKMKILDKEYTINGSSRQNSYIKAIITAFVDFKIHSFSNNIQLRSIYERIVIDIFDYMNYIKLVEHKSKTTNEPLQYFVNIKIDYFKFIGFGSSKKIAYENAVIESLMFFANYPNNHDIFSSNINNISPTNQIEENNRKSQKNDGSQSSQINGTNFLTISEKKISTNDRVSENSNSDNSNENIGSTTNITRVYSTEHFAAIFSKPYTKKMWTYSYAGNVISLKLKTLDKVYVKSGLNNLESYMKAIMAAFKDLKIHHSSSNVQLKKLYDRLVLHIYEHMHSFETVKTTTDQNGSSMSVVSIQIDGQTFIGSANFVKDAYIEAVINVLKFLSTSDGRTANNVNGTNSLKDSEKKISTNDRVSEISNLDTANITQNSEHFAAIFLKPHTKKMWTYSYSGNVISLKIPILDKVYVKSGLNNMESQMKAIMAAFIDLKMHHSSSNEQLQKLYERLVLHIHEHMHSFKIITPKKDMNGSLMSVVSIKIDGKTFTGSAILETEAYNEAVINVLKFLSTSYVTDCTSSTTIDNQNTVAATNGESNGPIDDLCRRFSNVVFEDAVQINSNHSDILFKTIIKIDGKKFEGSGSSKKLSKTSAAISALSQLCNINYDSHSETPFIPNSTDLPQHFADKIAKLVYNKFDNVTSNSVYNNRKIIAGIVMTKNGDINNAKLIAVATGTKIINGLHLSNYGSVINDSHAEIIARRCLVNYLYSELELHNKTETAERSIFLKPAKPGKFYKLKNEIKFHLFINSTPCGDAANFNPNDEKLNDSKSFELRKLDGQLRAKIESSEGTLPITKNKTQTWDGILQSERLLTMSCSDKIARWNVLGIQGSLLSTIIEPIYFDTIIIGRLYRKPIASRAFWGRLENTLSDLPINYTVNKPKLSETTFRVYRDYAKSPEYSVNWIINEKDLEVINARTGKVIDTDNASRLAKKSFFSKYQNLMRNLPNARELYHVVGGTYYKTKQAAEDYQIAKKQLFDAFKQNDLGYWLVKPPEQNQFMSV